MLFRSVPGLGSGRRAGAGDGLGAGVSSGHGHRRVHASAPADRLGSVFDEADHAGPTEDGMIALPTPRCPPMFRQPSDWRAFQTTLEAALTLENSIPTVRPPEGFEVPHEATSLESVGGMDASAASSSPAGTGHDRPLPVQSLPETVQFLRPPGNWTVPGALEGAPPRPAGVYSRVMPNPQPPGAEKIIRWKIGRAHV